MVAAASNHSSDILARCVSIDLEVDPKTARIFAFAAVKLDPNGTSVIADSASKAALDELDAYCQGFDHVIGHNVLRHDLPHLAAAAPRLTALAEAPIDTLWLNPLAFPRNPYHHLVKHYHDGRLQSGHVNDPECDARLVFDVLGNQIDAFEGLQLTTPDALTAYHFLATRLPGSGGFDALFSLIRNAGAPSETEAFDAIRRLLAGQVCANRLEQSLGGLAAPNIGWPMAYALSWISVAGGDSVMPPWVRMQFREASLIVRHLPKSLI